MRNAYRILLGKSGRKKPFGRSRRRWKVILDWILEKYGGRVWTEYIWFRIGTNGRLL
jgi:hypothetical protein